MSDDPVTVWLDQLREANDSAAEHLWQHFMQRLLDAARLRLQAKTRRVYDEEDAVQSAFRSVCIGVSCGRYPNLTDRQSLFGLLLVITSRKVSRRHQHDHRLRRNVDRDLNNDVFMNSTNHVATAQPCSREPTPEFAAEFSETCEILLESLPDEKLQRIVTLRLEGFTDSEIAERIGTSRRTVQRKLEIIRRHWNRLEAAD